MRSRSSGRAWPATRDGGGRGGAHMFLERAGERGWIRCARAPRRCGGDIAVLGLAGDGAEGGRRR
jgi:hypothetical protein